MSAPIAHPAWCVAPFCSSEHPSGYRHGTVPIPVRTFPFDDIDVSVSRQRGDEFTPSNTKWVQGEEGVLLRLDNMIDVGVYNEAFMHRSAVRRLIRELQAIDAQIWGDDDTAECAQ